MLYYCQKDTNTTETHKRLAACGEGAVTDRTCQCGLRSFVLEISHWAMLHGQSGTSVEIDSNQIKTLIENNQCSTMWEVANILKISKSIKLLVKMKNVYVILRKNLNSLANPVLRPGVDITLSDRPVWTARLL